MARQKAKGFSDFEFLGLIAIGLVIAGLLAHFIFDQSIQVERLNALVSRDSVRLEFETRVTDLNVIAESVSNLPASAENDKLRACIFGSADKTKCVSREKFSVPMGSSCLNEVGHPIAQTKHDSCFASAEATLEPLCLSGEPACRKAYAVLIHYRISFQPAFLKSEPELANLERTVSLVLSR